MSDANPTAWRPPLEVRRRLRALPAALALHAAVLGVLIVAELWAVGPVVEVPPEVPLIVSLPPPPAGGGQRASQRPSRGSASSQGRHEQAVQPPVVPEAPARAQVAVALPDRPDDLETEVPGQGEPTGPGLGSRELGRSVGGDGMQAPRRVGGDVSAPVAITRTAPAYPELARRLRVQGVVLVEAVINDSGDVVDVRLLRDIGMGCGQAAAEAVRSWKYRPATVNGHPVSVYLDVTVNFQLHGAD